MTVSRARETGHRHTELVLVRHGVTAWNHERRFQGQIDVGLDDAGRAQAELTGRRLAAWQVDAWRRWRRREPDFVLPGGGESLRAFQARVAEALGELVRAHPGHTVVAVTHGGVLDIAYRMATGMPLEAPRAHDLLNAGLNRIRWDGRAFSLVAWADVAHLASVRGTPLDDVAARRRDDPLESQAPRDTGATR